MINNFDVRKFTSTTTFTALTSCLIFTTAACSNEPVPVVPETESAKIALAADGDLIRLDGVVVSSTPASPSSFVLDYGADNITVEVDDWGGAAEGIAVLAGDSISVTGRVDEGLFNTETIEAGAVYVRNLNTVFYANPADEEEFGLAAVPMRPVTDGADYTGWVTGKSTDSFTLGAGPTMITVNTDNLGTYYSRSGVETGDRVYVWGDLTIGSNSDSKLSAEGLLKLVDGSKSKGQAGANGNADKTGGSVESSKASS